MNMDEIAHLCGLLSLKEREGHVRNLDIGLKDHDKRKMAHCLVENVLYNRLVYCEALMSGIKKIWWVQEDFEIEVMDENIFTFYFNNGEDRTKVFDGGLWSFDQSLIVLEEPVGTGDITSMNFGRVKFWVQIHNVLLLCVNNEVGLFLGCMIGNVKDVDIGPSSDCGGKFIRIRVEIQTVRPLQRCLRVYLLGDRKVTILIFVLDVVVWVIRLKSRVQVRGGVTNGQSSKIRFYSGSSSSVLIGEVGLDRPTGSNKISNWNARGLGNDWMFRVLHVLMRDYLPGVMFILETKSNNVRLGRLRVKLRT
ncbi:hypothetical protein Ddye_018746 [Dipteronia dyeriana]|uniref:DUF4283 domain-containing protein n=1 Tax=Dipteronia dyeriana TaxID=168575 RepID=A0AAD9X230_9ROSI|nr:hypothetical protein Ddye_018746 [Dipteronia dyeriana]